MCSSYKYIFVLVYEIRYPLRSMTSSRSLEYDDSNESIDPKCICSASFVLLRSGIGRQDPDEFAIELRFVGRICFARQFCEHAFFLGKTLPAGTKLTIFKIC